MIYLDDFSAEIERLCMEHKVKTLYDFGSVVFGQFEDKSDIDFIVDFEAIDLKKYADNYFDLKFSLQDILKKPIDLIEERAIKNPYFKQAINNKRKLVYGH